MFKLEDVLVFYDEDPSIERLRKLDKNIRVLQYGQLGALGGRITEGRRMLMTDSELLNAAGALGADIDLERLNRNYESELKRNAANPSIEQFFHTTWTEDGRVTLLLPLDARDGLKGLSKWYAEANEFLLPGFASGPSNYVEFTIYGIPNLTRAYRVLSELKHPREFDLLNIALYPSMIVQCFPANMAEEFQIAEDLPPRKNRAKKRYKLILGYVHEHWEENGDGVRPIIVWQRLCSEGKGIQLKGVRTHMANLYAMGLLQRTSAISGREVKYSPLGTHVYPK